MDCPLVTVVAPPKSLSSLTALLNDCSFLDAPEVKKKKTLMKSGDSSQIFLQLFALFHVTLAPIIPYIF